MSNPIMSVDDLESLTLKSRLEKKKALELFSNAQSLLNELKICQNDSERIKLWKEFYRLLISPHSENLKSILLWSKIINDPNYKY